MDPLLITTGKEASEALSDLYDALVLDSQDIVSRAVEQRLRSQELRAEARRLRRDAGSCRWPEIAA